jgi:DNA-binding MarR family transcriptional regulator
MVSKTLPPLLRSCWIKLNATFQNQVAKVGLTPDQYTVLRWLNELEHESVSQKDLKRLMFTDANNIAALVKRMESSGLIKRFQHPSDQRKKILATTPKGKSLYFRGKEIAESVEQALLDGFSSEEKDEFIRVLTKTNSYLLNASKEP